MLSVQAAVCLLNFIVNIEHLSYAACDSPETQFDYYLKNYLLTRNSFQNLRI
jgi:hypothetical protein